VDVRFERSGPYREEAQHLVLAVQRKPPGLYLLAVRVTDQLSGRSAEAQRTLVLE
jgi:hypothetical protein